MGVHASPVRFAKHAQDQAFRFETRGNFKLFHIEDDAAKKSRLHKAAGKLAEEGEMGGKMAEEMPDRLRIS